MQYDSEFAEVPVRFRVEHHHESKSGLIEVRRYFWSRPVDQTLHALSDHLVLNMALTSRPARTRVDRVAPDEDPTRREAGRLLVMIPGMPYHLIAPSGSFRCLHCAIDREKFSAVTGESIDWARLGLFSGEPRTGLGIEVHLMRIHDELVSNRIGRGDAIDACVELICVELARRFCDVRPSRTGWRTGGLASWRMKAIIGRVYAEGAAPRLAELAELCGLTERQLGRAFKAETGTTIGRFVDEATMERAHRLLTTTSHPIQEVARELGFASADSFAHSYRRLTGTSPSHVRPRQARQ
ncbi:helix-turn-helix protein [Novosphingobium sp. PhB55]|uniref:helix-turn-helix domain-containing protein n=1 Tax=Novosphingobium sp. PhB55 TaxID=2485106 RepID=UPI001066705D|nr:helix-turn-helix transcriptional regulator [Novosphingobium sp. PhB55]TDW59953.1 helix-turn-helix protein [Novosphingobium sp. PhB55]